MNLYLFFSVFCGQVELWHIWEAICPSILMLTVVETVSRPPCSLLPHCGSCLSIWGSLPQPFETPLQFSFEFSLRMPPAVHYTLFCPSLRMKLVSLWLSSRQWNVVRNDKPCSFTSLNFVQDEHEPGHAKPRTLSGSGKRGFPPTWGLSPVTVIYHAG